LVSLTDATRDEIEIEDRRRTASPREMAAVMVVAHTVEDSTAVMLHDAKGVNPRGLTLFAQGC